MRKVMNTMLSTGVSLKFFQIFKIIISKCSTKVITLKNINQKMIEMEYAVRGPVSMRADQLEKELAAGQKKSFTKVIKANLGDGHAMGQKPITFFRQVLALVSYPELLGSDKFPSDAKRRAQELLASCRNGSVGAYTDSLGIEMIRKHVAQFIEERDGFASDHGNILLISGASDGIRSVLQLLHHTEDGKVTGIMTPIPQYPLYSAKLVEMGMKFIGYYLNEDQNWGLDLSELQRSIEEAKGTCNPKGIVIINPGNPTGQVLTKKNIEEVIRFAYENRLVLLADEVYQDNVYGEGSEFHSFKKVMNEMGEPYCGLELASFMSCSKGYMGECGIRAGYCELFNFDPAVKAIFAKCVTSMLCPNVLGQCLLDCVMKPPVEGDPSYEMFNAEKEGILNSLKAKAEMAYEVFNSTPGFSCNAVQGAMYAFPKIDIPKKAEEAAKKKNLDPDTFYAFELLEQKGISMIAGSGFKQKPGTYHLRTTILPPLDALKEMLTAVKAFQEKFLKTYS